ncbi:MAG: hypothetical protein IPH57_01495 [Saprospiraceae bacterium]|nr:hypothetical protein [Saprospiraceae bacterium]
MLSLKDFKEYSLNEKQKNTLTGGICSGGGFQLTNIETRTTSLPSGGVVVEHRNWYRTWTSDDITEVGVTYYGVGAEVGNWY